VQAALIVLLTSALLLLAASGTSVRRRSVAHDGLVTRLFPPAWFVGLHETLAGSVIDSLPRRRPQQFLAVPERDATALYRSLWPLYHQLAVFAIVALAAAAVMAIAAYAWNNRRLPASSIRRPRRSIAANVLWRWLVAHAVAPSPLHQAGFWFTLQTLPRRVSHRSVVASSFAIGLALIVITVRGSGLATHADLASVPLAVFAGQSLLLASVLTGVRHAAQVPAELPASSTFILASRGHMHRYMSGVKRAVFVGIASPILAALFLWHAALLGVRLAALHSAFGVLLSMLLLEVLFVRYRRVPFVSGYVPATELKSQGVAYVVAMLCLSFVLAWIERLALETTSMYLLLVVVLAGLTGGMTAFDRSHSGILNLNEDSPLPTQRLDLAG